MAEKNWTGDSNSIYKTLGASNHTPEDREKNDFYATDPRALELLLELEAFWNVLEPACGEGHLSKVLIEGGIHGKSIDLIDRGFGEQRDFFSVTKWDGDIVTNPPYKYALQFVKHALNIIPDRRKVAMFLKVQFLEGKKRGEFFRDTPPAVVYISSSRILCAKNADFDGFTKNGGSAVAYAWFIWQKGYIGQPVLKWFN